jgi:hypothetical protein
MAGSTVPSTSQPPAHRVDHRRLRGAGSELERDPVEGAFHVHGRRQFVLVDPEHAERAQVGHAKEAGEDVFGRQADAGDDQRPPFAVDQRRDPVAGTQAVGVGEALGDHRLERGAAMRARHRQPAGTQRQQVQPLGLAAVQPD